MAEVRLTLDEYEALRRLITSERESEGAHEESVEKKKTRKKTKNDKNLSKALTEANGKAKKKNGDFRKGWDQSRLMTHAHALCKKM
jgi:hypothetical protein